MTADAAAIAAAIASVEAVFCGRVEVRRLSGSVSELANEVLATSVTRCS
jgi:hypothetical protein